MYVYHYKPSITVPGSEIEGYKYVYRVMLMPGHNKEYAE